MTKGALFSFIDGQKFAVLSTVNAKGAPEAALVGIAVTPELEIVFDTVKTSRKYANLSANPAAAFVVGCTGDKTLQYEGMASELRSAELERCKTAYFAKFPDGPSREAWPAICYFVLTPKWIRFSDYGETPALIEEFRF
jgi:pyridoxine/pyridoxamine 5'-phosphate oxidase